MVDSSGSNPNAFFLFNSHWSSQQWKHLICGLQMTYCIQNHLNNTEYKARQCVWGKEEKRKRFYSLETCPLFIFHEQLHPHKIQQDSWIRQKNWSSSGIKHTHTSFWANLPLHLKGTLRKFRHFISRPRFFNI